MKNTFKKHLGMFALVSGMAFGTSAHAGIPVIDATNLAQQIQQVAAWAQQFQQMQQQFGQLQQTYNSLNGIRGFSSLINNPALRKYLPADYQTILNSGYGNWEGIRTATKVLDIAETSLNSSSLSAQTFNSNANQAAINRAMADEGYKQAAQRFDTIQALIDNINNTPDSKDVAELQARIQAEQVMMQNEQTKLMMVSQLVQAQRDLAQQRGAELRIKNIKTPSVTGQD